MLLLKNIYRTYILLLIKIIKKSVSDLIKQDGVEHAGYLAFLSILSLFPFLIFLIAIIGLFGASEQGIIFVQYLLAAAPKEMSQALAPRVNEIISGPNQSFLTIAILGVVWTASSSVEGLRTILNKAYRVDFPPPYLWRRFISIIEFLMISFIIVIGIIIFIIAPKFLKKLELIFSFGIDFESSFFYFSQFIIVFIIIASTSLLYYILPNAKQKISQTLPGSILSVILWSLLQKIFSFYLSYFNQVNFVYGSLAGIIVSLVFFYLVSLIFILGAEFNYHFHKLYSKIRKIKK
jgi:membrane protein